MRIIVRVYLTFIRRFTNFYKITAKIRSKHIKKFLIFLILKMLFFLFIGEVCSRRMLQRVVICSYHSSYSFQCA